MDSDISIELQNQVNEAAAAETTLEIHGYRSKSFYGRSVDTAGSLDVSGHRGILSYDPSELVITARAGTPLTEVQETLAESGQMLPFEPPHFAEQSTLGGAVAAGLSGPGRPWRGAVRDVLLGIQLLDGKGQILKFGGQVMKNVAGYDLSRLMAGSLGTLGVLLEISVRLMPLPVEERTLILERDAVGFRGLMRKLRKEPVPISGASFDGDEVRLRLSGHPSVLEEVQSAHGGLWSDSGTQYWQDLRDHRLGFFHRPATFLWRVSVPPDTPPLEIPGEYLIDWGGAQHWILTDADVAVVDEAAKNAGGHAILFRRAAESGAAEVFHALNDVQAGIHQRLKAVFDPSGILNPGRLYASL